MVTKTLLTVEQFSRLADDDQFHELDEGELITMAPASGMHGLTEYRIATLLIPYLNAHPQLGAMLPSDTGFILHRDPDIVRSPDVAFLRMDKVGAIPEEGFIEAAPDLAVEVVSPSESATSLDRKVRQYLEAGTEVVWLVHRKTREVHVLERDGKMRYLTEEDSLEAPQLLPGFSVKVKDLFPR